MPKIGVPELIIILVIVVLLFGVGRVTKIGGEIGSAIKAFRKGVKDEGDQDEKKSEDKEEPKKES
jgi:sec-independent protein translocase protein TatA